MLSRCEQIMREVCEGFGADLREFNGDTDHVHLLVHYPPNVALVPAGQHPSKACPRDGCVNSSQHLSGEHFWSPSYFAGSCGGAPLSTIKDYIEQQKRPG
jgi:putative transposase